jgi:uncharacterized protein (DUF1697 family)
MSADIYIALLRGVNVGGTGALPTSEFVAMLANLGLTNIKTYIQTGNAVFRTTKANAANLPERLKAVIHKQRGFAPEVVVLTLDELRAAVAGNPFPQADADPKSLHLTFLAQLPQAPALTSLQEVCRESEHFALRSKVFYFHAPEGVARSKAFSRIEKALGVPGTARNWRSTGRLLALAEQIRATDGATPCAAKPAGARRKKSS